MREDSLDFELDQDELQILEDIEAGKYVSLKETDPKKFEEEAEKVKVAAQNTIKRLTKKKTYSLKLNEEDINTIKGMALREGLPYQTYISSLLHKIDKSLKFIPNKLTK